MKVLALSDMSVAGTPQWLVNCLNAIKNSSRMDFTSILNAPMDKICECALNYSTAQMQLDARMLVAG